MAETFSTTFEATMFASKVIGNCRQASLGQLQQKLDKDVYTHGKHSVHTLNTCDVNPCLKTNRGLQLEEHCHLRRTLPSDEMNLKQLP